MADWENYKEGLHQVGDGAFAYLQPPGSWGLNNPGLVVAHGRSLLIDAPIDIPRTRKMMAAITARLPDIRGIDTLLLTHWHLDHVWGAAGLAGSKIVCSKLCAEYLTNNPPARWLELAANLDGDARKMMEHQLGVARFDFTGVKPVVPDTTFEGKIDLTIGGRKVEVREVKPSHTLSDSVVFIRDAGVVHMGDLVTAGKHVLLQYPAMNNLIDACRMLIKEDARAYIPGHGPVLVRQDIEEILEYLQFMQSEARRRFDRGMSHEEAAFDLLNDLGPYKKLAAPERVVTSFRMIFREFEGDKEDFLRRDNREYLATQWRLRQTMPQKFPALYHS